MVLDLRTTARDLELLPAEAPWALLQGEALNTLKTLPDGLADALITDEPYSSGGMMRSDRTASPNDKYATQAEYLAYSGDNRDARSWAFWCVLWLTEAMRVVKPGGYLMMFTDWRQLPLTTDVFQGRVLFNVGSLRGTKAQPLARRIPAMPGINVNTSCGAPSARWNRLTAAARFPAPIPFQSILMRKSIRPVNQLS